MPNATRRDLLCALGILASSCCQGTREEPPAVGRLGWNPVADRLHRIPLQDIRLEGYLGRRLDLCIRNGIMARDHAFLVEPFRNRDERECWQTEFWGKWFTSAADAYSYTQDSRWLEVLRRSVTELINTQAEDGYIGNYADRHHLEAWDIWGRKYTLLGLLAWHGIAENPSALDAACRLTGHLMNEVGHGKADIVKTGNYRGMASSSVLEPVALLCRLLHDERFLSFAGHIIQQWSSPDGPQLIEKALAGVPVSQRFQPPKQWWSWENGQKAYEMMSCYEGLLELYRITGEQSYLQAVLQTFENIRDTEIMITGSGSSLECWYGGKQLQAEPSESMMETCVTTAWMKLCQDLLLITGEARFADELERSAYNALLGAMTPSGNSFGKYSPLEGVRELGLPQCGMDLNCCTANGPRGMMLLPETAVMSSGDGAVINLYTESTASVRLASGNIVRISQQTSYPASGAISLTIEPEQDKEFPLDLRIPSWSELTSLSINGEADSKPQAGSYTRIERVWKPGDRVELRLDLRARSVLLPNSGQSHVALVRGPVVLARDNRLEGSSIDAAVAPVTHDENRIDVEPVETADTWMSFRAPLENGGHILLCDYASAGNTWDDRSRFRVWLPRR